VTAVENLKNKFSKNKKNTLDQRIIEKFEKN
jgi:hypothetical protein